MSRREAISRYTLIINKLRRKPATFKEITDYLLRESELQSYNFNVSKRTFQRDLQDILSLYNIDIRHDTSIMAYRIFEEEEPEVNERILEAFDTFNALNVSDRLSKYIHFEKRRPKGTENLYGILHGIKNNLQIGFTYHKYWEDEVSKRTIEPYALKEFKSRWYIIGKDLKDSNIKSFGLDRLTELDITKKKFKYPADFNLETHFKYSFGVINPSDEEPQEIVLTLDPFQGKYIKSLPLHESQEIVIDNEEELRVKLKLCVTHDLVMELLSLGENVKVLKPKALINQVKSGHQKAFKQY